MPQAGKRPWLAAILSLLHPGIGHLYLREWVRAVLWFCVIVTGTAFFIPESAIPQTLDIEEFLLASKHLPLYPGMAMLTLTIFSMVDAYALASRRNRISELPGIYICPSCDRELDDPDHGFCPWCAEPLTTDASETSP